MSTSDIDKAFVSHYDQFLRRFDSKHEPSASQKKEIEKHRRIARLRDNPKPATLENNVWHYF